MSGMVTVILNSYNQARYLATAVDSALSQTYPNLELIAIDNGSTDHSPAILESYSADTRVRLFLHRENVAITRRFNEAVQAARGEFVSFLYSDDYYLPGKLERQVELFRTLPSSYGVVYGPAVGENERTGQRWISKGIAASGDIFADMMLNWQRIRIDMVTPLTRRSALLDHPFDEELFAEGEAIFHHIALTEQFAYLAEPLAVLRDHGRNAGKAIKRNRDMSLASLARLRADPSVDTSRARLIDRYEGSLLRAYGWQAARLASDGEWARNCLIRSARVSPREALHPKMLATLLLTLCPVPARRTVNRLGHALRGAPSQAVYVEEYEGLG